MHKLWQKNNEELDSVVEAFETGADIIIDQKLIAYDVEGSIAHAKMLEKIEVITKDELALLIEGLTKILILLKTGEFVLELGDEDMHSKIETFLIQNYGDVGKKIHTMRSRNDQVLTALRLFTKFELGKIQANVNLLRQGFETFDKKYGAIPMPGYTHMQKAMPSSIGLWAKSFIASLEDDAKILSTALDLIDQSPLGSAAGYGLPMEIDRQYSAKLLNFQKVQENPLYCQATRGKFDAFVLSALIQALQTINKFASDVLFFTTSELGFFHASSAVTTGSSIMPQKKNLDLAELLRSKVHIVLGNYTQIVSLSSNLISGFNRDIQDAKKPLIESLEVTHDSLVATKILLENITPNHEKLEAAMTHELFATEEALKLTRAGETFRDAYKKVGQKYNKGEKNG